LVHLGIDIDQFILLTIYPAAAFFAIGFAAKKIKMRPLISYLLQAATCFAFAVGYYLAFVHNGGALGLAIVLIMFGAVLLFMARKQAIQPEQSV
jgi:predicted Kef-type K+ transport protein